jgi:hypothetical protein
MQCNAMQRNATQSKTKKNWGVMAHAYNLSYLRGRGRRIWVLGQLRQKVAWDPIWKAKSERIADLARHIKEIYFFIIFICFLRIVRLVSHKSCK